MYWKMLSHVPASQVIQHRIIWSFLFLIPIILLSGRRREFAATIRSWKALLVLALSALLVMTNWFLYIWAVTNNHLLQASLGYYINPLVNVLLGTALLKERLRRLQVLSVGIASVGVLYMTFYVGQFPWISLTLAFTFGFYGLIRKTVNTASVVGLAVETLLLSIPAWIYLLFLTGSGNGVFLAIDRKTDLLLMGSSVLTTIPLLLFTVSARRLTLSTVGFIQYLAPTCMFLLGVFMYREPFALAQVVMFILIWIALSIYSLDSIRTYRRS